MSTWVRCMPHQTEDAAWVSVEVQTGATYHVLCRVPAQSVRAVPAEDCTELESLLAQSLIELGRMPAQGIAWQVRVELGEVGGGRALVRVQTQAGPVVCRVPVELLVEEVE